MQPAKAIRSAVAIANRPIRVHIFVMLGFNSAPLGKAIGLVCVAVTMCCQLRVAGCAVPAVLSVVCQRQQREVLCRVF